MQLCLFNKREVGMTKNILIKMKSVSLSTISIVLFFSLAIAQMVRLSFGAGDLDTSFYFLILGEIWIASKWVLEELKKEVDKVK